MKNFKKSFNKTVSIATSPFTLGIFVTIAITWLAHEYYTHQHDVATLETKPVLRLIRQIHEKTIDFRMVDRGQKKGSDRVAILAIDEKSIEQEGRWPWPRDKMGRLIERTLAYGAKDIAFDIIWSEEDGNSSLPTLSRLRENLTEAKTLTPELSGIFERELGQADTDGIFGNIVAGLADNLVMGAYFETYDNLALLPMQEICLDALYSRTPEIRYWKKETSPLEVIDDDLRALKVPEALKAHLPDYFTQLEVKSSTEWFDHNPAKISSIERAMKALGDPFPAEAFPGLAVVWINGDVDTIVALLEQVKPELANKAGAEKVLAQLDSAFSRKEKAMLQQAIRMAGEGYCHRFFTPNDDLASAAAYEKVWGSSEELKEAFAALSLKNLWEQSIRKEAPEFANLSFDDAVKHFNGRAAPNVIENIYRWWINIPVLGNVTKHTGYFNAFQDLDGSIRRSALVVRRGNSYMPSLALKTFLVDSGYTARVTLRRAKAPGTGHERREVQSFEILGGDGKTVMTLPVDASARAMINHAGRRNMFPYISAGDILSDQPTATVSVREFNPAAGRFELHDILVDKREFLKDKVLITGATATGVYDLRVTPFEENYPGVETHANMLSNLLVENERASGLAEQNPRPGFLRAHPDEEHFMLPVLVLIGLLLSGLLTYFGSIAGLAVTAASIGGVYSIDKYFLFNAGTVAVVFFPMMMVVGDFVALTFYKYFTEERKKRELKGTFEKYVSPAIVAEVLADPENIELGGKKMELTVMFSDVRGFTTISEKLDPRALSDLLNSYLTPMTNLVFEHKGTLDKYMGDAVMAFWGAPIHFADHAKHACRCALAMLVKLKELQEQYRMKGLPEIDIGIGLNTGEMSVGNMGSDTVRSYTVMGDSVNLGSRLEGINKEYGTRIIISEFTQRAVQDSFVTREVDWVRVKGKAQPVRIFELVAEGKAEESKVKLIKHFEDGFQLYHEREFAKAIEAFKQGLAIDPDDAVTQLYIERCEDYLAEPPPANWDGVYTMKTK